MHAEVRRYYAETLKSTGDLKTTACCTLGETPEYLQAALARLHPEVVERYYGCGLVLPEALAQLAILDLGCGAGRDAYLLAQLAGEQGRIVGVDMTPEQLQVARRHEEFHRREFGYARSNVEFVEGNIEQLDQIGLPDDSFDLIVSNCVVNLATDKLAVLAQAWRLLKTGGELYFADIYADRRIPGELRADPVLYGECLSGALCWQDFFGLAREAGFADPRLVEHRPVAVKDRRLADRLGDIRFASVTCRLFKLPELGHAQENYGDTVRYRGGIPHHPDVFRLDAMHSFPRGRAVEVSVNTRRMLDGTRFRPHFDYPAGGKTRLGGFAEVPAGDPFGSVGSRPAGTCCQSPGPGPGRPVPPPEPA